MCDIFALSSGHNYTAQEYLAVFAEKAKQNMDGWGIGFFRDGQALLEKSAEQVFDGHQVHESFQRLARVIDSRIIVSHISCPLSGGRHSAHNNPFALPFLDHIWIFVNVGRELLSEYPGQYTFFLANESVLFGFTNFRRLLLLRKTETLGDILLVTSVGERLSPEEWLPIEPDESSLGKLLVIAGPDLLYLDDI